MGDQLVVGAILDRLALGHDNNVVGVSDGKQTVADDDHCSPLGNVIEGLLNNLLGLGIEGRGRLIKEQNFGIGYDAASDDDTLLLATGERRATFSNDGVVTLRQVLDKVVGERRQACLCDQPSLLVFWEAGHPCSRKAIHDILVNVSTKEGRFLLM